MVYWLNNEFATLTVPFSVLAGLCVAATVWQHIRGTYPPGVSRSRVAPHAARAALVTLLSGFLWPAVVITAGLRRLPEARRFTGRHIFGDTAHPDGGGVRQLERRAP